MKQLHPKYWLARPLIWLLRALLYLPWPWQIQLGKLAGYLMYRLARKSRHNTWINIQLCFPELSEAAQHQLIRDSFTNAGIGLFETANAWWTTDKRLGNRLTVSGREHLETALKQNQGVLLLGSHQSCLQLAGRLFAREYPIGVVYRKQHHPVFTKVVEQAIHQHYQQGIPRGNLFALKRALLNKQIIWYTPDVDPRDKASLFVPFFNVQAATVIIPSRFAQKAPITLLPVGYHREANNRDYHLAIAPPISAPPGEDYATMLNINQCLEAFIRAHPSQYLWQYQRFKTRPAQQPNPYKLFDKQQLEAIS